MAEPSEIDPFSKTNYPHLAGRIWHSSAPKSVRKSPLEPKSFGNWAQYLADREKQPLLRKLTKGDSWPLLWAAAGLFSDSAINIVAKLADLDCKKPTLGPATIELVETWIAASRENISASRENNTDANLAIESLAVAQALPRLASVLPADLWWHAVDLLVGIAQDGAALDCVGDAVRSQLLGGELAVTLAVQLPEIVACRDLGKSGRRILSEGIVEVTDGEGMIQSRHLPHWRTLLACWTRSLILSGAGEQRCFKADAMDQFQWMATNALRFARRDGSQAFGPPGSSSSDRDLLANVLGQGGDAADRAAAVCSLPALGSEMSKKKLKAKRSKAAACMPEPATNSEWAALAALRANWSIGSPRVFVRYDSKQTAIEIELGSRPLVSGIWDFQVERDGKLLPAVQDWSEVCWTSDDDVDYLELEIALQGNVRLQRQILLAREDEFLYVADVVLSNSSADWTYQSRLPLAGAVQFTPADESSEGTLSAQKPLANVFPLALPEWRDSRAAGSLKEADRQLHLAQSATGTGLNCALFLDLKRSRLNKPFTWRQLTVAEKLEVQPPDVAVGYRVQCGKQQWLFYRSLAERSNRTVLGQNTVDEFLAARFDRSGDIEELVEIQ